MSDARYDSLFDELKGLEDETGIVLSNSPTQEVGYRVVSKLHKVKHSIPLLSLNKTKDISVVEKFIGERLSLMMLKYDGLTVELVYEDGKLIQASTRGDGQVGEDITHNAKVFLDVPLSIPYKNHLKVVGEAIILKDDFGRINVLLADDEKYKTPRNLVSGSVRQLDSKLCAGRKVRFALWDVLEGFENEIDGNSRTARYEYAANCGFQMPAIYALVFDGSIAAHNFLINGIEGLKRQAEISHVPIDGVVIKYDNIDYSKSLGGTSHHNNDGIAYKFDDETAETILREIEWSIGRTGQLTPVAVFDTVDLDNTDVSRASLHNISIIEKLELGIGDCIVVAKANQIIPQIVENITRSNRLEIPNSCPVCGEKTKIIQENDSKVLVCTGEKCNGKLLGQFSHFVSRPCMNIEGLSQATLEKFISMGWLKEFKDIYNLERYKNEIMRMDGFGKKSYEKLIQSIEKSRRVKLDNFIPSLGIHNVGKTAGKALSKQFGGSLDNLINAHTVGYDFTQIPDFGQIMSDSLSDYLKKYVSTLMELSKNLFFEEMANLTQAQTDNLFSSKTVVVTGSLQNFTRASIQEKLETLGAKVSGSVSKNTDYLIVGENAGSKMLKAQDLGVEILTEAEFLNRIKE